MWPVILLAEAENDLASLIHYYKNLYPPATDILLQELDHKFEQLSNFPESYQMIADEMRKAPLFKLHLSAYYAWNKNQVEIVAILPDRLDPEAILKRLSALH